MTPTALTIAGSDPSGGAGIQADLKTFSALKVYGMTVITALTAQNTIGVSSVTAVASAAVAAQLDAVITDIRPMAVKTGMLFSKDIVETVSAKIRQHSLSNLVVDPVMTASTGSRLLQSDATDAMCRLLLPLALIVTPNLDEASVLSGIQVRSLSDMEGAAILIQKTGPKHVLIKGGHLEGDAVDVFFDGKEMVHLTGARIATEDWHGTGCVLSAAIAGYLARGESLVDAVRLSKGFVTEAIRNGLRLGAGRGPCDPLGIQL